MKILHFAQVESGQVRFTNRKSFDRDIAAFNGMRVKIEISEARKGRSNDQNARLWGLLYAYAVEGFEQLGHEGITTDDVHRFFKDKFLPKGRSIADPETGNIKELPPTTTILTVSEMTDYMNKIETFCNEFLNVTIPQHD